MKRRRKSKVAKKRIFNESMVRYFHARGIKYYEKVEDEIKNGRRIYWYETTPEFYQALESYSEQQH